MHCHSNRNVSTICVVEGHYPQRRQIGYTSVVLYTAYIAWPCAASFSISLHTAYIAWPCAASFTISLHTAYIAWPCAASFTISGHPPCQLVHHSVSLLSLLSAGASLRQSAVTSVSWCITPSVCCHFCQLVHHSVSLLSLLSAGASLRQSAVTSVSWCITPSVCCHSATSLSDSFCHVTSVEIVRSKVISTQSW